jgi:hypothetical protein
VHFEKNEYHRRYKPNKQRAWQALTSFSFRHAEIGSSVFCKLVCNEMVNMTSDLRSTSIYRMQFDNDGGVLSCARGGQDPLLVSIVRCCKPIHVSVTDLFLAGDFLQPT